MDLVKLRHELLRPRGTPMWDAVLRATGVVGLLAIYPASRWPEVAAFVGFLGVTMALNGPLSPVLPAAYEPVLMSMGRVYAPMLVAFVGIIGILYIELLNYHLYRAALTHRRTRRVSDSWPMRKAVAIFGRAPFFCVWLCSWSPLPYWTVRMIAPVAGYPVGRYLFATFLGRGPRLWFFAALGPLVPISTGALLIATLVAVVLGVLVAVVAHNRSPGDPCPASVPPSSSPAPFRSTPTVPSTS